MYKTLVIGVSELHSPLSFRRTISDSIESNGLGEVDEQGMDSDYIEITINISIDELMFNERIRDLLKVFGINDFDIK